MSDMRSWRLRAGEMVATLDARGHVVVFHLLRNRYEHLRHVGSAGTAIAFSTRRKNELFVSTSDGSVQVFDVASKQLVAVLKGHRHAVSHISLNSTGTLLVTSSVDAAIIWSTGNWTRRRTLGCGAGVLKVRGVGAVCIKWGVSVGVDSRFARAQATFLPSAELLAAAFLDDTVLVWDSVTYEVVARLSLPEREGRVALSCFDLSLDGRYLLAGAKSGSCYLWELRSQVRACAAYRVVACGSPLSQVMTAVGAWWAGDRRPWCASQTCHRRCKPSWTCGSCRTARWLRCWATMVTSCSSRLLRRSASRCSICPWISAYVPCDAPRLATPVCPLTCWCCRLCCALPSTPLAST